MRERRRHQLRFLQATGDLAASTAEPICPESFWLPERWPRPIAHPNRGVPVPQLQAKAAARRRASDDSRAEATARGMNNRLPIGLRMRVEAGPQAAYKSQALSDYVCE